MPGDGIGARRPDFRYPLRAACFGVRQAPGLRSTVFIRPWRGLLAERHFVRLTGQWYFRLYETNHAEDEADRRTIVA